MPLCHCEERATRQSLRIDSMLAFHPKDYRDIVEKEYNKRLKIYGI